MTELNLVLALVGGTILVKGLLARPLNRSVFSLPLLAFLVGVIAGPLAGLLHPSQWGDDMRLMEETARLALGISLMGIALRLPRRYVFIYARPLLVLICIGMPLMWLISAGLSWGVLEIALLPALMLGASVCATDPVVASSIVTGGVAHENLPGRFRHTLSSESAINDGLAFPLVMLPVLLLTKDAGAAWTEWLLLVLGWKVIGAVVFGVVVGLIAGWGLRFAEKRGFIDEPSFLVMTLTLTLFTLGSGKLLGLDSILAVFTAGVAFDQEVGGKERAEEANIQEAINLFFTLPVFMLFGLMIPWAAWTDLGWSGLGLVLAVLALRRLPVIVLLRPWIGRWRDLKMALLAGWFGPIGVSALFYATLVHRETGNEQVWVAASLLVAASLIAHGVTAAPIAKTYGRRYGKPEGQEG